MSVVGAAIVLLACGCILLGTVHIPAADVLRVLCGDEDVLPTWRLIIMQTRLPMAATAALSGAALAVAGLLLQTTFSNPLAGPSILGISTGSSLGVAIVLLACGGVAGNTLGGYAGILAGAMTGAVVIIIILLMLSSLVRSTTMLLIVGIMTGYLASSAISLLNFFATQEGVHSFVIWGLGNFTGVTADRLPVYTLLIVAALICSMLMVKPLNAMLLGSRYAANLGINIRSTRNKLLLLSGLLTAIVTAFCGPIGFIGLVVPHVARMLLRSSNHMTLLPVTALTGAATGLLCALLSVLPIGHGVIPINAITPVIGFPIVIYVIINRKKIMYFN